MQDESQRCIKLVAACQPSSGAVLRGVRAKPKNDNELVTTNGFICCSACGDSHERSEGFGAACTSIALVRVANLLANPQEWCPNIGVCITCYRQDPFIVYTSNIWAILNLRSLFTILSSAVEDLVYLRPAVAAVLAFVGAKLGGEFFGYNVSIGVSLGVITGLLGAGIGFSLLGRLEKSA